MILLIDNFDSFTHNLKDYLLEAGAQVEVVRNIVNPEVVREKLLHCKGVVISPGPGKPESAGNLMEFLNILIPNVPVLGICLGHQAIGTYFGGKLSHANKPMHGKISEINCEEDLIFTNIPKRYKVVRYHSLIISQLPEQFKVIAKADNEIMAFKHNDLSIYGIQFHPEAIMTEYGKELLKNWLTLIQQPVIY